MGNRGGAASPAGGMTMDILSLSDSPKFVLKCHHNHCHVTTFMVQSILSHDNERELNDGRRIATSSQRARLEPVQRQKTAEEFLLCSQVEARPNLPGIRNKVVRTDERKSSGEDRRYRRVVNIFSVTAHSAPSDWTPISVERSQLSPHVYYRRNVVLWQQAGQTTTLRYNGQGVAGRDSL